MTQRIADRIYQTSVTTGTGPYQFGPVMPGGYRAFSDIPGIADGDTVDCYVDQQDSREFEVGTYTYRSGGTLERTTLVASSNGGAPVDWQTGTRRIGLTFTARQYSGIPESVELAEAAAVTAQTSASSALQSENNAENSENAADESAQVAQNARDGAIITAGEYLTEAAGIAATRPGDLFRKTGAPGSDTAYTVYLHDAGGAPIFQTSIKSVAGVAALAGNRYETGLPYIDTYVDSLGNSAMTRLPNGTLHEKQIMLGSPDAVQKSGFVAGAGGDVAVVGRGIQMPSGMLVRQLDLTGTAFEGAAEVEMDPQGYARLITYADGRKTAFDGYVVGGKVPPPQGFNRYTPDFDIFYSGQGKFTTNFDIRKRQPFTLAAADRVAYVDPAFSGTSTGTAAAPWKTLYDALNGATGKTLVMAKPGRYGRGNNLAGLSILASQFIIRPWGTGRVQITTGFLGLTWVNEAGSGRPNVWTAALSGGATPVLVVDLKTLAEPARTDIVPFDTGCGMRLAAVGNKGAVNATPGSFFASSTEVAVYLPDGRAPDADVLPLANEANVVYNVPGGVAFLQQVDVWGGATCKFTQLDGSLAAMTAYFDRSTFKYGNGNALWLDAPMASYSFQCVCDAATSDGFNYHRAATAGIFTAVEIDCIGRNNGFDTTGTNNGSTMHDFGVVVRVGGYYGRNQDRNVHDINGHQAWMLGCEVADSRSSVANMNIVSGVATIDVGRNGITWLDGCFSRGSQYDLGTYPGGSIRTRRTTTDGQILSGSTITAY